MDRHLGCLKQFWVLFVDGSTGTLYTRFNYELHILSTNEYIRYFILCILLVLMHLKIKKNIYFSALTINEINETAQLRNFGGNEKIYFILRIKDELSFSGAILVC